MRMATHGNVFFFMCFVLLYIVMYLYILSYIIMYLYILYIVQCCYILFTYIFNRIVIFFLIWTKLGLSRYALRTTRLWQDSMRCLFQNHAANVKNGVHARLSDERVHHIVPALAMWQGDRPEGEKACCMVGVSLFSNLELYIYISSMYTGKYEYIYQCILVNINTKTRIFYISICTIVYCYVPVFTDQKCLAGKLSVLFCYQKRSGWHINNISAAGQTDYVEEDWSCSQERNLSWLGERQIRWYDWKAAK